MKKFFKGYFVVRKWGFDYPAQTMTRRLIKYEISFSSVNYLISFFFFYLARMKLVFLQLENFQICDNFSVPDTASGSVARTDQSSTVEKFDHLKRVANTQI